MSTKTLWTAEMLEHLPEDDKRYELDEGELIRMSPGNPTHGRIAARLVIRIGQFVERNNLGEIYAADTGFTLGREPDTVRAPDVTFVRRERLAEVTKTGFPEMAPDLAIEVASPSETATSLDRKIKQYLRAGTTAVWVVAPRRRDVTIHHRSAEPQTLGENDIVEQPDLLPGFHLAVKEIF